nr:hypothetical protein GZ31B6_33 [uncultured archaeon GZfos31B6]
MENKMEGKEIISLIVGIIVGGFAKYFWDRLTLTHEYKLKTISDRIDEFVKDSKKYWLSGNSSCTYLYCITLQNKTAIMRFNRW